MTRPKEYTEKMRINVTKEFLERVDRRVKERALSDRSTYIRQLVELDLREALPKERDEKLNINVSNEMDETIKRELRNMALPERLVLIRLLADLDRRKALR